MKELITAISERLASQVPELQFIDINLGQLQLETPPVDFPCALIDISNVDYSSCTGTRQIANVDISVTLAFKVYAPSDINSDQRSEAMQHYDLINKVAKALHGYGSPLFSKLTRTSLQRQNQTYPRHFTMNFKTSYTESFEPTLTPARPTPEIKI